MMSDPENISNPPPAIFRLLPGWRGNLLLFGFLIFIVLSYFYWQVRGTQKTFFSDAREHSRMLAGVIELNARGALLSQTSVEEILGLFMGNTARFVDYLDSIEPFVPEELTAFAQENGLDGVFIHREDGTSTMGPSGWFRDTEPFCRQPAGILKHMPDRHLYVAVWPRTEGDGCVGVGVKALAIEAMREKIGLDRLLKTMTGIAGIRYVRLLPAPVSPEDDSRRIDPEAVVFLDDPGGKVAEVRRPLEDKVLLVGLDAEQYYFRIRQIWGEFFLFGAVLAILGSFFSWLLYRYQQFYYRHIRTVEQELSREREDAALGRSATAIAHEIRNPLNAIGMGLQRLRMEAEALTDEERTLIATMLQALKRADGIVENIRLYARPLAPNRKRLHLGRVVQDVMVLYRRRCSEQAIEVDMDIHDDQAVSGDLNLISQAIENLIKNSIEAQPDGGFLSLRIDSGGQEGRLRVENGGFSLPEHEADQILAPYYTTKTRGTGLGLAIVRKTILAHGGRMAVSVPNQGVLRVTIRLPLIQEASKEAHADTDNR